MQEQLNSGGELIPQLRRQFNERFTAQRYETLLALIEERCGVRVEYRIAETPVFLPQAMLEEMAGAGADLLRTLITDPAYLPAARRAIPPGYEVAAETTHPHFLTADFGLVREGEGGLVPRLSSVIKMC
jgi:hypothetical protein